MFVVVYVESLPAFQNLVSGVFAKTFWNGTLWHVFFLSLIWEFVTTRFKLEKLWWNRCDRRPRQTCLTHTQPCRRVLYLHEHNRGTVFLTFTVLSTHHQADTQRVLWSVTRGPELPWRPILFFLPSLLGVAYYGMHTATARVLWSVQGEQGGVGGCHHDNGVAKGAGTTRGKGKECACCESSACMSSPGSVRVCARVVEGVGAGWVLWSVRCEVTMQSPVRVWEGGGIIMGCLPPLCVCEDVS